MGSEWSVPVRQQPGCWRTQGTIQHQSTQEQRPQGHEGRGVWIMEQGSCRARAPATPQRTSSSGGLQGIIIAMPWQGAQQQQQQDSIIDMKTVCAAAVMAQASMELDLQLQHSSTWGHSLHAAAIPTSSISTTSISTPAAAATAEPKTIITAAPVSRASSGVPAPATPGSVSRTPSAAVLGPAQPRLRYSSLLRKSSVSGPTTPALSKAGSISNSSSTDSSRGSSITDLEQPNRFSSSRGSSGGSSGASTPGMLAAPTPKPLPARLVPLPPHVDYDITAASRAGEELALMHQGPAGGSFSTGRRPVSCRGNSGSGSGGDNSSIYSSFSRAFPTCNEIEALGGSSRHSTPCCGGSSGSRSASIGSTWSEIQAEPLPKPKGCKDKKKRLRSRCMGATTAAAVGAGDEDADLAAAIAASLADMQRLPGAQGDGSNASSNATLSSCSSSSSRSEAACGPGQVVLVMQEGRILHKLLVEASGDAWQYGADMSLPEEADPHTQVTVQEVGGPSDKPQQQEGGLLARPTRVLTRSLAGAAAAVKKVVGALCGWVQDACCGFYTRWLLDRSALDAAAVGRMAACGCNLEVLPCHWPEGKAAAKELRKLRVLLAR